MNSNIAIIPAAGFGRRVGSPPAKELLPHPYWPDKNFLEVTLSICKQFHLQPLIISRVDKVILNQYVLTQLGEQALMTILESCEWTETVLKSRPRWGERNILLLPDAYFTPLTIIQQTLDLLKCFDLVVATHKIDPNESPNWGVVDKVKFRLFEKPISPQQFQNLAWGVLGFRNTDEVLTFWQCYHMSRTIQQPAEAPAKTAFIELDKFLDLARG
jgi:hypothetical protein